LYTVPAVPPNDTGLERTAFEAATRNLAQQADELNQMRSRTGTLLAAGSITASFLGAQTLGGGPPGLFGALALVAFVGFLFPCIYVLLPKRGFMFSINATVLYESLFEIRDQPAEYYRRLTYWLEGVWQGNQTGIDSLTRFFFCAAILLMAEIGSWAVALRSTLG
jgi:hypothetical protein